MSHIVKFTDYKATTNITFNSENLKLSPLRPETPPKCPFPPLLLNIVLELLIRSVSISPKESIQIGKKHNYLWSQRT